MFLHGGGVAVVVRVMIFRICVCRIFGSLSRIVFRCERKRCRRTGVRVAGPEDESGAGGRGSGGGRPIAMGSMERGGAEAKN